MRIAPSMFVVVLACAASAQAESTNQWYLRGPEGGAVLHVQVDRVSGEPLAGGNSGMFRYDGGLGAWQYANAGAPTVFAFDIEPTSPTGRTPSTFAVSGGFVVRSDDGGQSWTNVSGVLMAGRVVSISASSSGGQTRLYAGRGKSAPDAADGGVWFSTDFGATWTPSPGTAGDDVTLVRAASTNPNLVFYGAADADGNARLHRSTDGGQAFTVIPVAQTSGGTPLLPLVFYDVQHARANPSTEVIAIASPAGGSDGGQGGQLFVSNDDGASFSGGATAFFVPLESAGGGEPRVIMYDSAHANTVYFGTTWGVFRSVDGGAPVPVSNGLMQLGMRGSGAQVYDTVNDIAQSPDPSHTLYVATRNGGVFVSTDEAANWQALNAGLNAMNFRIFAFQPGNTGVVLAGSADPVQITGVYRSTDGGASWQRSSSGMNPSTIRGLAFAPPPNQNIVLATGFPQQSIGGEFNKGAWRSADSGQTWTPITDAGMRTNGGKRLIQFDPNDANRVLISAGSSLVLSTDGGVSWINSINHSGQFFGLPLQVEGNLATPLGIAAGPAPVSGTRFYIGVDDGYFPDSPPSGAEGGVYFSDDGGYHWTRGGSGLPDDSAAYFAISPIAGTLFVSKLTNGTGRTGGVFKSTDYGQTFVDVSATLPCRNVFTIAADPVDANVVWTGCAQDGPTQPGGIFRSNDAGTTWVPYGRGLRVPTILWMTIDPADHDHVLAGGSEGIHEMHFAQDADSDGIPDGEESQFAEGDANNDGTADAEQSYVASAGIDAGPTPLAAKTAALDYVVVEIDRNQPFSGTCQFVSDLAVIPLDQVPPSDRMQQAAPTIRFTLPNCTAAQVKVRYSAVASYPVGVFGSYSPAVPGDIGSTRWGLLAEAVAQVSADQWTLQLDQNAYGNVYAPDAGTIQFQGAPGRDSVFADAFE